jgi:hypothetical protein
MLRTLVGVGVLTSVAHDVAQGMSASLHVVKEGPFSRRWALPSPYPRALPLPSPYPRALPLPPRFFGALVGGRLKRVDATRFACAARAAAASSESSYSRLVICCCDTTVNGWMGLSVSRYPPPSRMYDMRSRTDGVRGLTTGSHIAGADSNGSGGGGIFALVVVVSVSPLGTALPLRAPLLLSLGRDRAERGAMRFLVAASSASSRALDSAANSCIAFAAMSSLDWIPPPHTNRQRHSVLSTTEA